MTKKKEMQPRQENFKMTVDALSNKIFEMNLAANKPVDCTVTESNNKKIESTIRIINGNGEEIQLNEMERAVFNAYVSELSTGRNYTTAKALFRRLGGGSRFTNAMHNTILEIVEKLAKVYVQIESTAAVEKGIVDAGDKVKDKNGKFIFKGYLMPTEVLMTKINGQEMEVIAFLKNSTTDKIKQGILYANADRHDQIITAPQDFMDAEIKSTPRNIALNHYLLRRVLSIKGSNELAEKNKHVKPLRKIISVDDMLKHCGLTEYTRDQKKKILKIAKRILEYFIAAEIISDFYFETGEKGKILSIILEF